MIMSDGNGHDRDEEWYPISGWVPMILAEYRLTATRHALAGIKVLVENIIRDAETEARDEVEFVRKSKDPDVRIYIGEAEEFAEDRILAANSELPYLFFGSVIVYLMSTLEATLAECLDTTLIVLNRPPIERVPNPKLESYIRALDSCGVSVEWSDDLWAKLRAWRQVRNTIVHDMEMPQAARFSDIESANASVQEVYSLVETAIAEVDEAMLVLESSARR
jgi:hypothetical protein